MGNGRDTEGFLLELPAAPVWVATARLFASAVARQLGCSEDAIEDLKLGISESCGILVRSTDGARDTLSVSLIPRDGRLLVEVVGGPEIPEGVIEAGEATPESFARSTSVDVLRSVFTETEISPVSGTSRVSFDLPV